MSGGGLVLLSFVPQTDTGSLYLAVDLTRTAVSRAFTTAGPTIWNSLPDELRDPVPESFKDNPV